MTDPPKQKKESKETQRCVSDAGQEGAISFILAEANFNRRCPSKAGGSTPFILDEANFNQRWPTHGREPSGVAARS